MVRIGIGGKGMSYIVKNCPCYWHIGGDEGCDLDNTKACEEIINCVIKQVINYCLEQNLKYDTTACDILQLFNIEEINK